MRNLPEDVDRTPVAVADEPVVEVAPEAPPATPWEWVRRNLFSSWFNSLLTIVIGPLVLYVAYRLVRWVFVTADWGIVKANLRLYMVGRFPEEAIEWVWASGFVIVALSGLTVGASRLRLSWTPRRTAIRVALAVLFVLALIYLVVGWVLVTADWGIVTANLSL